MKSLKLFTLLQKSVAELNSIAALLRNEQIETDDAKNKTIEIISKVLEQLKK